MAILNFHPRQSSENQLSHIIHPDQLNNPPAHPDAEVKWLKPRPETLMSDQAALTTKCHGLTSNR